MLSMDLSKFYGVPAMRLNEQVKRNINRFPDDFMFQLSDEEYENLKSQFAISSWGVFMGTFHLAISSSFSMSYNRTQSTTEIISHAK